LRECVRVGCAAVSASERAPPGPAGGDRLDDEGEVASIVAPMGKFDRRSSQKMKRRKAQVKKKARLKRKRVAPAKRAAAPKKAAAKKSSPPKSERSGDKANS
jgi:hypothetical protein